MGKEARYKKEGKEVDIQGILREEELFQCSAPPGPLLLILTFGTLWAAPLGPNASKNVYTHVIRPAGKKKRKVTRLTQHRGVWRRPSRRRPSPVFDHGR